MNCLVVFAHPLPDSLNRTFAATRWRHWRRRATRSPFSISTALDFDPRLSAAERAVHYDADNARRRAPEHADLLTAADALVLVFPTLVVWPARDPEGLDRPHIRPGRCLSPRQPRRAGRSSPGLDGTETFAAITTLGLRHGALDTPGHVAAGCAGS